MSKNPLIPFALIAVFGIGLMFLLGFVGLGNMDEMANAGEEQPETAAASPEEIFQGKCSACHGADLSGSGAAPALTGVGGRLSVEEIQDVITNGRGTGMPPGLVQDPVQVQELATWLSEQE
ncbi:cytochrome c550 [Fredinandcohnia sp. 179-A 10B2 NHS]|uniref:cytochrome c550 n=1 Tax=Fredinandcohnia sp. 179-A 10B2 NHS TaxID=3235176 RepID=UPI0039A2D025